MANISQRRIHISKTDLHRMMRRERKVQRANTLLVIRRNSQLSNA